MSKIKKLKITRNLIKACTQLFCEKPITEKQVDNYINSHNWQQSMFTYDCVLVSKQFAKQAKQFSNYGNPFLLKRMIIDYRNANAYLWIALEVAKYEAKLHIRFWEDRRAIILKSHNHLIIDIAEMADLTHRLLRKHLYIQPLQYSEYGINNSQKILKNS